MDFTLTKQQNELKEKARNFAKKELLPIAWYYDKKNKLPLFLLNRANEHGLMNTDIPEKYGGRGYGLVEGAVIIEEFSAACSGLATSIFDNSLGLEPILLSGNEKLKENICRHVLKDNKLICFATSEPGMGSDVASIKCKAEKNGNNYILNGTKFWITNAGVADYATVFATVDPSLKHSGICAFVVDMNSPGILRGKHIDKLGQRNSNTAAIHFSNVEVPSGNMIAEPGEGFVLAMKTFSRTRPMIAAFAVGAARTAMEVAIHYSKKRRAFGSKLNGFEAIQFKIAEMYQKVETSRLLLLKAAWEADSGIDPTVSASIAKMYATESAFQVASEAMQICGGYGYTKLFPLEKILRDIRLLMIYEGTSEIQRVILAGHAINTYKALMPDFDQFPILSGEDDDFYKEFRDKKAWRCSVCGEIHYGDEPPEKCPVCFMSSSAFSKVWPIKE